MTPPSGFRKLSPPPGFAQLIGPFYSRDDGAGWARGFWVGAHHTNALGYVHGGMLMAFMDTILAAAAAHAGYGPIVTVRVTSDFVANARQGDWLEGTGDFVGLTGDSLLQVRGRLYTRRGPVLLASGTFQQLRASRRRR